jgi:hypothetical protein
LAYGSLLAHPGGWLGAAMGSLIRCETPFGVEYVGRSQRHGGAPTPVRSENAKCVRGGLIVLDGNDTAQNLNKVMDELGKREGNRLRIKSDLFMLGYRVVYSDFVPLFKNPSPDDLADAAIESVVKCFASGHPLMNGIRYLAENIEWGVKTELTQAYLDAVLSRTKTNSLEEAEAKLVRDAWLMGSRKSDST